MTNIALAKAALVADIGLVAVPIRREREHDHAGATPVSGSV
jgi:hypothetical protein